jgi:hypothetical protein
MSITSLRKLFSKGMILRMMSCENARMDCKTAKDEWKRLRKIGAVDRMNSVMDLVKDGIVVTVAVTISRLIKA